MPNVSLFASWKYQNEVWHCKKSFRTLLSITYLCYFSDCNIIFKKGTITSLYSFTHLFLINQPSNLRFMLKFSNQVKDGMRKVNLHYTYLVVTVDELNLTKSQRWQKPIII